MSGYEKSTYSQLPQPGTPNYTEAWALIEAARRMAVALEVANKDDDLPSRNALRAALQTNWKLWTIFQAELTLGNSQVPDDIRQNMLTLCKYIDQHSVETLRDPSPERVASLIDINRNIGSGLLEAIQNAADSEEASKAEVGEKVQSAPNQMKKEPSPPTTQPTKSPAQTPQEGSDDTPVIEKLSLDV